MVWCLVKHRDNFTLQNIDTHTTHNIVRIVIIRMLREVAQMG
jgi:hypothetical protein